MKNIFKTFLIVTILLTSIFGKDLKVGDKIGSFSAYADDGEMWHSDSVESQYMVIYFYPAAMTFGCTKQACSYRDNMDDFKSLNAEIIGVSGDDVAALKVFKEAENLNFTLLSDNKGKVAEHFGVPTSKGGSIERKVNDKKVTLNRGVTTKRWTFIIDKKGEIIYKDDSVNPLSDTKKVLKKLQK